VGSVSHRKGGIGGWWHAVWWTSERGGTRASARKRLVWPLFDYEERVYIYTLTIPTDDTRIMPYLLIDRNANSVRYDSQATSNYVFDGLASHEYFWTIVFLSRRSVFVVVTALFPSKFTNRRMILFLRSIRRVRS